MKEMDQITFDQSTLKLRRNVCIKVKKITYTVSSKGLEQYGQVFILLDTEDTEDSRLPALIIDICIHMY